MRIELEGVHKRFGKTHVLKGVSFRVPAGQRVALIGPNGSGKSTLLRSLLGLLACEGKILLDGRSPFEERPEVSKRLAYVPQVAPQLSATVGEIIHLVTATRELDPQEIQRWAARLDLDTRALVDRPFRNLSGGMKQKLLIATAFAARPTLLVMDEPTASLDAASRDRFFTAFAEVPPETTLVLCSHRLEELRHLAEHVVALEEGRVAYDGSAEQFLARRSASQLEVLVEGDAGARWLQAQGFRPGRDGWWVKSVPQGDKPAAVAAAVQALGPGLKNLLVRDLESVDARTTERPDGAV